MNEAKSAPNKEKIPKYVSRFENRFILCFMECIPYFISSFQRELCVFLNESYPVEELAQLSGISLEQYQQIILFHKNHTDHSPRGLLDLTVSQYQVKDQNKSKSITCFFQIDLCHVVNPDDNGIKQSNVELTDEQSKEFLGKIKPVGSASIDQRVPLLVSDEDHKQIYGFFN